ncbi:MAG: M20/M25/M40 family metallo-hydrolase [Planctomycetes bacterium]|nr:M20/M25/M40 family metallo-hydrolase [Planctomycetota bacterium]
MSPLRLLLPLLFVPCYALAQDAPVAVAPQPAAASDPLPGDLAERIVAEGMQRSQVMRLLGDLTGKVGQRLTGSDNFTKACEWSAAEFAAMGLSNVHREKWGEWKLVWNRGPWIGRIVQPIQLDMYVATEAWTAGTKGLQRAAIIAAPTAVPSGDDPATVTEAQRAADAEAAAAIAAVAGKWVVSRRLPRSAVRKACEAAGVLGFVYRAADPDDDFPTRVRVFGNHQTAMKPIESVPTVPQIAVRADDFDRLFEQVESGKEVVAEFDIQNSFRDGPIQLDNVIAEIPGTEKPDEVVIVSAHLDSWHQAQGCTDNGTGTTTTLEAARILAAIGAKPKRTIRFCLWGGEEQGLLGSRGYVQKYRTEMGKVSAVLNHDTGTNWAQSLSVTEPMRQQLEPVFAHVRRLLQAPDADWQEPVFELKVVERVAGGGGSDHASFLAAGVPGLDWGLKGRSDYFRHTWHTQWDTYDVAIEEYQRHTSTVVALAALGIANLDQMLDRANVGGGRGPGQSQQFAEAFFEAELDGLAIKTVKDGGRAAKWGLVAGDVLVKVEGQEIESVRQIFQFAREAEGEQVTFTFRRGDQTFEAKAPKGDLPQRRQRPARAPGDTVAPGAPADGGSGSGGVVR